MYQLNKLDPNYVDFFSNIKKNLKCFMLWKVIYALFLHDNLYNSECVLGADKFAPSDKKVSELFII